jgi:hypothetical protein
MMWTSSLISCILIVSLYMRDRQWGISLPGVNEFLRNFLALQTVGATVEMSPQRFAPVQAAIPLARKSET